MIEPLKPRLHSFPVHVVLKEDGFADNEITDRRKDIIKRLKEKNMIFQFTSSDGDKHFNEDHEKVFKEYERMMEEGASFKDLVSVVGKHDLESPWPIADPLHLVKNIREDCLNDEII